MLQDADEVHVPFVLSSEIVAMRLRVVPFGAYRASSDDILDDFKNASWDADWWVSFANRLSQVNELLCARISTDGKDLSRLSGPDVDCTLQPRTREAMSQHELALFANHFTSFAVPVL